jgi:hypothetical protein
MNRGIAEVIKKKIGDGMGLLAGFFTMLAHSFHRDEQQVYELLMAVLHPAANTDLPVAELEHASDVLAKDLRENPVFHPSRGTLRELPKERGMIQVVVEAGEAPEPRQLPAGLILTQGVEMAASTCGTTLATFGPTMGLELVVEVDALYERMSSATQVFSAVCRNIEYLTRTEGRVDQEIFLAHVRTAVKDIYRFRRYRERRRTGADQGDPEVRVRVRV